MKKFFTKLSVQRLTALASLLFVFSLSGMASDTWYANYAQVEAYPTGAGKVYIAKSNNVPQEERTYEDRQTIEIVSMTKSLYVYPQPAEGWQCIGVSFDEQDENEEWNYVEEIQSKYYTTQDYIYVTMPDGAHTKTINPLTGEEEDADSITTAGLMPLDPNCSFKAVFTHATVAPYDDQGDLGDVKISKLANNIGDKVTLTATPKDERCHFVKWTLNGNDVSTESSIEVEVKGLDNYMGHFTADSAEVLHFAPEGEYKIWYSPDTYISIPSNVEYYMLIPDSIKLDGDGFVANLDNYRYSVSAGTPTILYGKGDAQVVKTIRDPYHSQNDIFAFAGENGVKIDTLDSEKKYYVFDLNALKFNKADEMISANSLYIGVPDTVFSNAGKDAPAVITLSNSSEMVSSGIAAPSVVKPIASSKKGVYTIDGRRVEALEQEGIYIFDGKKVLYRKRK